MRIRVTAPAGERASFRYLDSLHAALVNAWTSCGARTEDVVGYEAGNWSFGAVGTSTRARFLLKSVIVGAEGPLLDMILSKLEPERMRKISSNGDVIDLSNWDLVSDELPVMSSFSGIATLPAIMLSPLVLSVRGRKGRWHDDLILAGANLQQAVNHRLSRITGRDVDLAIEPDQLYLRANPRHSTVVRTRAVKGRRPAFVIGTMCPLMITGRERDLRSAWALGIGEKNRYGFGCIGHAGGRA